MSENDTRAAARQYIYAIVDAGANLAAHQPVLAGVLERTTPLPMTFGVIAEHEKAVEQLLAHHHTDLREQLDRVAGTLEMGLRVKWDVPNIFEYFVNTQDRLPPCRLRNDSKMPETGGR